MAENTKIQWCDHSASPWHGCQHAELPDGTPHPGCLNCYAETNAGRNPGTLGIWGPEGTRVVSKSFWSNCRRWNREAEETGVRQSVFPSICDPFEDWNGPIHNNTGQIGTVLHDEPDCYGWSAGIAPGSGDRLLTLDDLRRDLFALIDECQWLDFLLLTKRPGNILKMWQTRAGENAAATSVWSYRHNVALITSVSDQPTAEALIPELLKCRGLCPVLGVSAEPLLGPVDFTRFDADGQYAPRFPLELDWVIVGGESGSGARPCDLRWMESIVAQCKAAGVSCFVKQLGANPILDCPAGEETEGQFRDDGSARYWIVDYIKDKKGGDPAEWPEDLRVRQFPQEAGRA